MKTCVSIENNAVGTGWVVTWLRPGDARLVAHLQTMEEAIALAVLLLRGCSTVK